jgi:DNA-binding CsgD family transcriptional regulator
LLTREDLALRVFFCGTRTVSRDLAELRRADPPPHLPLRGTVHDIGPVLTHRTEIVRLALAGKTMSEISLAMRHSPAAVANYLQTFIRVARLVRENIAPAQIAYLVGRGPSLVDKYIGLLDECTASRLLSQNLEQLLRSGEAGGKIEASPRGGGAHGQRS